MAGVVTVVEAVAGVVVVVVVETAVEPAARPDRWKEVVVERVEGPIWVGAVTLAELGVVEERFLVVQVVGWAAAVAAASAAAEAVVAGASAVGQNRQ